MLPLAEERESKRLHTARTVALAALATVQLCPQLWLPVSTLAGYSSAGAAAMSRILEVNLLLPQIRALLDKFDMTSWSLAVSSTDVKAAITSGEVIFCVTVGAVDDGIALSPAIHRLRVTVIQRDL